MSTKLPQIFDVPPTESELETATKDFTQFDNFASLGVGESKPTPASKNDFWVDTALDQDGKLFIRYIGSSFSERDRDLILEYLPKLYNVESSHIRGPILNEVHLLEHLKGEGIYDKTPVVSEARKVTSNKSSEQIQYEKDYSEWIAICSQRKNKIREFKNEVKILKLKLEKQSADLKAQIATAQLELAEVEQMPIPERPSKPDQG